MSRDRSNDGPRTAAELMAELRQDPEFAQKESVRVEQAAANTRAYVEAAQGLLADLSAAGFAVSSAGELVRGRRYEKAIPILASWMGRVADKQIKADIVKALSVPWARVAGPALVAEYRNTAACESSLRWAIANALEVIASRVIFDDLVDLALDREGGQARQMLALAIAKTDAPEAASVLMRMLLDEEVAGHAVSGLAQMKADVPREAIEPFLKHPAAWVRKDAKKLV